jgi:hypothetical protein
MGLGLQQMVRGRFSAAAPSAYPQSLLRADRTTEAGSLLRAFSRCMLWMILIGTLFLTGLVAMYEFNHTYPSIPLEYPPF